MANRAAPTSLCVIPSDFSANSLPFGGEPLLFFYGSRVVKTVRDFLIVSKKIAAREGGK